MSPFALLLHDLRMRYGVRQNELAELIGYDQTYISALEIGSKGPPTADFVERLVRGLNLSPTEEVDVRTAAATSDRKLIVETNSHPEIYRMLAALKKRLPELHPVQARMIRELVDLPDTIKQQQHEPIRRIRRRKNEEARM